MSAMRLQAVRLWKSRRVLTRGSVALKVAREANL